MIPLIGRAAQVLSTHTNSFQASNGTTVVYQLLSSGTKEVVAIRPPLMGVSESRKFRDACIEINNMFLNQGYKVHVCPL